MYKNLASQRKALLTMFVVFALLFSNIVPAFAADSSGTPGQKPLNFVGAYLTQINNNTSTTGADVTTVSVPAKPLIKVVVDKNVVSDDVWSNNQKCVTLQNSSGTNISANISRISDAVNFNERQNIFVAPLSDLASGGKYKIVVSPKLQAKNGVSTLGMTTNNQSVVVNFTVEGTAIVSVTNVTLDKTAMTVTAGNIGNLAAAVAPANATNKSVTWTSSNTSVATVSQSGTVTAVAPGKAVITVKTTDGGKSATCTVTVNAATPAKVSVTAIALNKAAMSIEKGKEETLVATVSPTNATNKAVTWSSSNTAVAAVNQNGTVTAIAPGTAVITVKAIDTAKTATCTVTVKAAAVTNNNVNSGKPAAASSASVSNSKTITKWYSSYHSGRVNLWELLRHMLDIYNSRMTKSLYN